MFEGPEETLTLTENAQPALMAVSLAVVRILEARRRDRRSAAFVAGHSLGEYSALVPPPRLQPRRHGAAAEAARPGHAAGRAGGQGAMAAILGLDLQTVLAAEADAGAGRGLRRGQRQRPRPGGDFRPRRPPSTGPSRSCKARGAAGPPAERQRPVPLRADAPGRRRDGRGPRQVTMIAPVVPLVANVSPADTDPTKSAGCWSNRSPAWCAGPRACSGWPRRAG